jgi:plasmid stability protein
LHQQLKVLAAQEGKTISEVVRWILREGLERECSTNLAEREQLLMEAYQAVAMEHAQLAEEPAQHVTEALDPNKDWEEYQE